MSPDTISTRQDDHSWWYFVHPGKNWDIRFTLLSILTLYCLRPLPCRLKAWKGVVVFRVPRYRFDEHSTYYSKTYNLTKQFSHFWIIQPFISNCYIQRILVHELEPNSHKIVAIQFPAQPVSIQFDKLQLILPNSVWIRTLHATLST